MVEILIVRTSDEKMQEAIQTHLSKSPPMPKEDPKVNYRFELDGLEALE
jgi:hypothetical protein